MIPGTEVKIRQNIVKPMIISDHLGSVRVTLKEDGSIDSWSDYYPFGKEARGSSTVNEPKEQFTGKERDYESGLDYFGARYYSSEVGRWVSVDPLTAKYPSMSPYHYVENNPVILLDPNGAFAVTSNGASVTRISVSTAQNLSIAGVVPGGGLVNLAYKALHNDKSYPIGASDWTNAAVGSILSFSGSFAVNWLEKAGQKFAGSELAGALLGLNSDAVDVGFAIGEYNEDHSQLVADELTFDLAQELEIGSVNIANPELFKVNSNFLGGLAGAEAQQMVENTFSDISTLITKTAGKDVLKDRTSAKKWFSENKKKLKDSYSNAQKKSKRREEDEEEN